jgi:hypothetical protein
VSESSVPSPNKMELSTRDTIIYSAWVAIFSAFLAAGLGGFYVDYPRLGTLFTVISAIGFIVMIIRLREYRLTVVHALIASIVVLIAACASLAYLLLTKPKEAIVHDPPTTEDVDKATAPIRAELETEKQRVDNAQSQQRATDQTQISNFQSQLAAANKTVDDLTKELNSTHTQLGPRSPILGLDDARRWKS